MPAVGCRQLEAGSWRPAVELRGHHNNPCNRALTQTDSARATFMLDLLALAVVIVITGHTAKEFFNTKTLKGMQIGRVPYGWAENHYPEWALALTQSEVNLLETGC